VERGTPYTDLSVGSREAPCSTISTAAPWISTVAMRPGGSGGRSFKPSARAIISASGGTSIAARSASVVCGS
jgi:hypothetical protein